MIARVCLRLWDFFRASDSHLKLVDTNVMVLSGDKSSVVAILTLGSLIKTMCYKNHFILGTNRLYYERRRTRYNIPIVIYLKKKSPERLSSTFPGQGLFKKHFGP